MQLENRNSRVSGFRDQDVVTLQKILDAEFELEKESIIKHQREKREQAAKQAGLQRKRMMLERQLREEIFEIEKDHRIEFWLTLVSVSAFSLRCSLCYDDGDAHSSMIEKIQVGQRCVRMLPMLGREFGFARLQAISNKMMHT